MKVLKAIKRGVEAAKQILEPRKYIVAEKQVRCCHCGGDTFEMPQGVIGTFSGYVLQCSHCGHPECFGKEPTVIE
jgi:hypothetical protein